ncbi:hypothetical protein HMPREF9554_01698 [Treponema phagedenis F0421]|nr:hypothetical protein HMPREF9554_01698 [Treponema phagedenis F0421]
MVSRSRMLKSERARTPVVPNRNEFKNYHTSIIIEVFKLVG